MYSKGGYGGRSPVGFPSADELIGDPVDSMPRLGGGDSISVTIRFRPLSEREYQRGDEVSWYADGDKLVRNEYNPVTSYAFGVTFLSNKLVYMDVVFSLKKFGEGNWGAATNHHPPTSSTAIDMHGSINSCYFQMPSSKNLPSIPPGGQPPMSPHSTFYLIHLVANQ
ncbi:unnamed protein product [Lactuca virosa]|uniref:Kinesin motor domain-containing protein n=1 Tax=Lactuca virosa TaxID=75947 RepID=A0AAU9LMX9_9ASTR|nr:unnamed protein product [Lactuca virosa]